MANIIYEVAAEFVIEAAAATITTNKLTKSIESLSQSVDNAIFGAARLGAAYFNSFMGGGGGVLGLFGTAIKSSEKFRSVQIELANTMISNGFTINGQQARFNDALKISGSLLEDISKKASKFNISADALAEGTKLFSAVLAPKGLAGDNLSNAVELSRVVQKGAPALGMNSEDASRGVFSALFGTLDPTSNFARIFAESGDVIKKVSKGAITDVKSFNKASAELRLKSLIAGLDKLAGSAEVVDFRAKGLFARLQRIKDLVIGVGSIFREFGDTLRNIIGPILDFIAKQIDTNGRKIIGIINNFFKGLGDTPKEFLLNMKQFASLHGDIQRAGSALRGAVSAVLLANAVNIGFQTSIGQSLLSKGGMLGGISVILSKIAKPLASIFGKIRIGGFLATLGSVSIFALRLIPIFGSLIILFQALSKAAIIVKIRLFETISALSGQFIEQFDRLKTGAGLIMEPFTFLIDVFAEFFATILDSTKIVTGSLSIFTMIADTFMGLGIVINQVFSALKSVGAFIGAFFGTLAEIASNPMKYFRQLGTVGMLTAPFDAGREAFTAQRDSDFESLSNRLLGEGRKDFVTAKNVHYNTFNNTFNIREKIEPDRIAFTMKEQLNKAVTSRRSPIARPVQMTPNF